MKNDPTIAFPTVHDAFRSMRSIRIVIAEDDREMRRLLCAVLRKEGYEVATVGDGNELLALLGSQLASAHLTADIIVSDICMPGHSGLEVLAGLRQAGWRTPTIVITAFGDVETHARARRLGAAAVLDKPFDMDVLLGQVLNLAARCDERWLETAPVER